MRILHVIQELRTGGAERVVLTLAAGARAAGHDVAVVAAPGELDAELEATRFDLPLVARRPWRVPGAIGAIHRAAAAWRPSLVHAHNPTMALATAGATVLGPRVPALVSVQGSAEGDWRWAGRALRVARYPLVACGPGVAAALSSHGLEPWATVTNGVGPAPAPADRLAVERDWGIRPGDRLVLAVGRLVDQKNHAVAVRALARVPRATLAILGDGPLRDDVARVAAACGVADRVVLAGRRDDARRLMGAADAVVLPSRWEGLPLTALEALAAGTPLVATAVRGTRDLLVDEHDALLVPDDDADALAAALVRVLDDRALAARLVENGRTLAAHHSDRAMVDAYLSLYAQAIET